MAYMSQQTKKKIASKLKPILQKHGVKGRLSVNNGSTLVLKITEGRLNFDAVSKSFYESKDGANNRVTDINHFHWKTTYADNPAVYAFLEEAMPVLNEHNWDRSDIQSDYFDIGYHLRIYIGKDWRTPYKYDAYYPVVHHHTK